MSILREIQTQCAAVVHLTDDVSSSVRYRCFRRAKKKLRKQQRLLREVVVSSDQLTFSSADIDKEIIVFDGGQYHCNNIK